MLLKRLGFLLCVPLISNGAALAGLTQPDCDAIRAWTDNVDTSEMIQIAPNLKVSAVILDERLAQLFGKPALSWDRQDFAAVNKTLQNCQRTLVKQRAKTASKTIFAGDH